MSAAILAHHELLFLAQGTASVGLAGWAAAIGARWYSITDTRFRSRRRHRSAKTRGDRTP